MNLQPRQFANVRVVAPAGRIDHASAAAFQEAFMPYVENCSGERGRLVLDFSAVDYMSSAGLRVLTMAAKRCQKDNGTVVIAGLQPTMQEIFSISRFDRLFKLYPQVRDALAALSSDALAAFEQR